MIHSGISIQYAGQWGLFLRSDRGHPADRSLSYNPSSCDLPFRAQTFLWGVVRRGAQRAEPALQPALTRPSALC